MDIFCTAIESHLEWRTTLRQHIDNQVFLHDKDVANPHRCVLGRWIDREATAYQELPSFNEACALHESFHQYAGEVAQLCNANDKVKAESLLEPNGNFHQASMKLIRALMDCDNELAAKDRGNEDRQEIQSLLEKRPSQEIFALDSTATVRTALQAIIENGIGSIVVYQGQELLGLFTDYTYLNNLLQTNLPSLDANISNFVEANNIYFYAKDSIDICKNIMRMTKIKRIPVTRNEAVIGILAADDFINA
jgi:CBS domain-containing protein